MPRILINDGFNFSFTSKPTKSTPEPVAIKYRPPTQAAMLEFGQEELSEKAEQRAYALAKFLAGNIGEWNAVDEHDKALPITTDTFLKIRDINLLNQFYDAIVDSRVVVNDEQKK